MNPIASTRRTRSIARLRRAFPHEWLLIEVNRFDSTTTTPVTGQLLAHSRRPEPLEKRAARAKKLTYLVFGSDTLPKGYALGF